MAAGWRTCGIAVGVLLVSGCAPQVLPPNGHRASGVVHVVKPGETLYRIGRAYEVSHIELARINRLRDPHHIQPGQRLFIPGAARTVPVETVTPAEPPEGFEPGGALGNRFIWPVTGTVNSRFGPRGVAVHDGIDIAAPEGTPVRSAEAGEVIYSDQLRGYGNLVIVRHAGGFATVYAHNQANLVREGQMVRRGEMIARVGSTGRVTAPHLHFEIRKDNIAQDPLRYLPRLCCSGAAEVSVAD
ncbi:MAG TPA: M23 family metallopeptidase [Candidatus Eisenbacteria bacterium]|nr:M23 family metallopeptidase [Candidatus Eisenbacteria bacterium]